MAAQRIACTSAQKSQAGRLYFRFDDGTELEFADVPALRKYVRVARENAPELLKALALARYLEADSTAANPAAIAGKSVTIDLSLANMVKVA